MPRVFGLALVAAVWLGGCTTSPTYDQFPIAIDLDGGVPIVRGCANEIGVSCRDGGPLRLAVDTAAPITVIDRTLPGTGERHRVTLQIDSAGAQIPRARFPGVLALESTVSATGMGAGSPIDGVIGGDVLSQVSVRLDAKRNQMFFFPTIPGGLQDHSLSCDAVFNKMSPAGGGKFELDGALVSFPASRMVIGACLDPDPMSTSVPPTGAGADGALVIATGMPITVITRSAYVRARVADMMPIVDSDIDTMCAKSSVFLPANPTASDVWLCPLTRFAMAANEDSDRGPCKELLGNRRMALFGGCDNGQECHCKDFNENGCAAGAAVEIEGPLTIGVISDTEPTLQEIRVELRPGQPDIDGLLGMDLLGRMIVDLDYGNSRTIFRCADRADTKCVVRPRIGNNGSDLRKISTAGCLL